jgi:nitronate monooxygenase
MGGAAGGKLAAEVSRAGGFGFIGGGYLTPSQLDQEFEVVDSILGGPTGSSRRMEIGVGFLGWKLSQLDSSPTSTSSNSAFDPATRPKAFACIDATLKKLPRAIWLAFGTSSDLSNWAKAFRERERALHGDRTEDSWKLFVGVGSEQEAKVAVEEVGADVIVAQGVCTYAFLATIATSD